MSASFTITLDTSPPAAPTMVINAGASATGEDVVEVLLASPSADVDEMKVWGDVDESADPDVQSVEIDSAWTAYDPEVIFVRLSSGNERKHLYARLRDDVGNETAVFTDSIDLDTSVPTVSITTPVDRGRISQVDGFDVASFGWQVNVDFDEYEVRLVPAASSPRTAGNILTEATGSFDATTTITTEISGDDLEAASVGDGPKVVKVFVRVGATWSM